MENFDIIEVYNVALHTGYYERYLENISIQGPYIAPPGRDYEAEIVSYICRAILTCEKWGFLVSASTARDILDVVLEIGRPLPVVKLVDVNNTITEIEDANRELQLQNELCKEQFTRYKARLVEFRRILKVEAAYCRFFCIERDRVRFWTNPLSEWEEIEKAIPEIAPYILRAAQSYAFGMPTACIFNLMCALEIAIFYIPKKVSGMRRFAPARGYQEWGKWIAAITDYTKSQKTQNRYNKTQQVPPPHAHALNVIASNLVTVKRAYRDTGAHAGQFSSIRDCGDDEAMGVYNAVRIIMEQIAVIGSKKIQKT